jgi:hypothetical protein
MFILVTTSAVFAGHGTITGREAEGWNNGEYTLILGVIQDVQKERVAGEDRCTATMAPRATLGGVFDASAHPILPVQFYVGRPTSSIAQPPEQGAVVLAVVQLVRAKEKSESDRGLVYSHTCTFMPGEAALVVLRGLDDPRIEETLKKLQDARAHPNPDPYGRPNANGDGAEQGK